MSNGTANGKPQFKKRKKLGEMLVEAGVIRDEDFDNAILLQKDSKKKLGRIMVEMGCLSEEQLTTTLSEQLHMQVMTEFPSDIGAELLVLIPSHVAQRKRVFPVRISGKQLHVAMADPLDWQTVDELSFRTGYQIVKYISSESIILEAIEKHYSSSDQLSDILVELSGEREIEFIEEDVSASIDEQSAESLVKLSGLAPVVRLVSTIIIEALKMRASDIHIEPGPRYVQVRFRIDGDLRNVMKYPRKYQDAVTSRMKIISSLDITNRRLPQDGHIALRLEGGKEVDLRVSTLPSSYGEKIVTRILDRSTGLISLSKLGMPDSIMKTFIRNIMQPEGLLLVTGPTGSGKSTTLYSAINQLQSETDNIVTIEDPIEYRFPSITQSQVNEGIGLTFARILRAVFRQDPDVILVGEIRDYETADITVRAALTGHFVLSTMHTRDTVSTITRMIDMGVPKYLLAATLTGIMAQRLVKKICPECMKEVKLPDELPDNRFPAIKRCFEGGGCDKCNYTGYSGRVGVYEFLDVDWALADCIARYQNELEVWEVARQQGLRTLLENSVLKIEEGTTTIEEVHAKISMSQRAG